MSSVMRNFHRFQLRKASTEASVKAMRQAWPLAANTAEERLFKSIARRLDACVQTQYFRLINKPGEPTRLLAGNNRACHIRALCMPCEYQRAKKTCASVAALLPYVWKIDPDARAIFLTLSTKNRPLTDSDLKGMLRDHIAGIRRLFDLKCIHDVTLGHYTAVEIAIREHKGEKFAGVHSHSMIIVNGPAYFAGNVPALSQPRWRDLWRAAAKLPYAPIVDVRVARSYDGSTALASAQHAARELIKYLIKVQNLFTKRGDRIEADPAVAATIVRCLRRQRLMRFDRIFMEAKKLKKIDIKQRAAANAEAWSASEESEFFRNIFKETNE
jgi:hypothetical protein